MFSFDRKDAELVMKSFGQVGMYFSGVMLLPIIVSLAYGEGINGVLMFLLPASVSYVISLAVYRGIRTDSDPESVHAMVSITLIWVILPVMGALPMMYYGMPYVDSYFESVSSLTTTGISVVASPSSLPRSLIFWRSVEGWIGGAGIVVLALMGLFHYVRAARLMDAEGRDERLMPSAISTVKAIWKIYGIMTAFGVAMLLASNVPLFDAVNYSMSAISTTGTRISNGGLVAMNNIGAEVSLMLIMAMGAMSFAVHNRFMRGGIRAYFRDVETKFLFFLIIASTVLLFPSFAALQNYGHDALRHASFYVVSAITAGGFESLPRGLFNEYVKMFMIVLMLVGGAAGSTAGGIKLIRAYVFAKAIFWKIKKIMLPSNAYFPRKVNGEEVKESDINMINTFIILYISAMTLGTLVLLYAMPGLSMVDAMFAVTSAQGNVGIEMGVVSAAMPAIAKMVLCANMILGRIEIIPIMAALGFVLNMRLGRK